MDATTRENGGHEAPEWSDGVRVPGTAERERFVLAHAPLVRYVAQRIVARLPSSVEVADLVNDGLVGLIEALERFDPSRGVRFSTFAEARVRGAILDALREQDSAPRALRRQLRALDSAALRAEQQLGRAPDDDDLAREMGVSRAEVSRLRRDREAARPAPVDARDGGTLPAIDPPSVAPDPFEQVSSAELLSRVADLIAELPERERLILGLYYEKGLTLKEIGEVLRVTESRICQIHTRTVRALRDRLGTTAPALPAGRGRVR